MIISQVFLMLQLFHHCDEVSPTRSLGEDLGPLGPTRLVQHLPSLSPATKTRLST